MGLYAGIAGFALLFPHRPAFWPLLALLHLAALFVAMAPDSVSGLLARIPPNRVLRAIADWYPILIIPALYNELQILNVAVHNGSYFDPIIIHIEATIFGGQPSHFLAQRASILALSEVLHACYMSYYLVIYGPPFVMYMKNKRSDFELMVFTLVLSFFMHYVFFIYFPVQGPRYLFAAPGGVLARGPIYQFTHRALEIGSSRGAAFPSSHVGVAVAQCVLVKRMLPKYAPVVWLLSLGLAVGAVYGGFHYATDAFAGLILGLISVRLAPRVRAALT
jgi:membrane-associated phospholipid phosphatase